MRELKLYLDACCLNRPFDDQDQESVRLEAAAVENILIYCETGPWVLVSGSILRRELVRNPDEDRRAAVLDLEGLHQTWIPLDPTIVRRATDFQSMGIASEDALHLATAEKAGVDYFLTTDYVLLRRASRLGLPFPVLNPRELADREMTDG